MAFSLNDIEGYKDRPAARKTGRFQKWLNFELNSKSLSKKEKLQLYSQLALLLKAGLNLKSAMELCLDERKENKLSTKLKTLIRGLEQGDTLSKAMTQVSGFSDFEAFSIKMGEESGNLSLVLEGLRNNYQDQISRNRAILGALSYPIVIACTAFGVLAFMFSYLVPMFKDLFSRMDRELPWLTQMVIEISSYTPTILFSSIVVVLSAFLINGFLAKQETYLLKRELILNKVPFIGKLVKENHKLQFLQSLHLMLEAKVPLIRALEISRLMLKSPLLKSIVKQVEFEIVNGARFSEAVRKSAYFETKISMLLKVGEETNQLASIVNRVSQDKLEEIAHRSKLMSSILEPLTIVFLGAIVALILISMYLPMFQMGNTF